MIAINHKAVDSFNQQARRVWNQTVNRGWFTLNTIAAETYDPVQSISARLRDFRKEKFGSHTVERRMIDRGLYEYRVIPNGA
jgi:hypothetical protein